MAVSSVLCFCLAELLPGRGRLSEGCFCFPVLSLFVFFFSFFAMNSGPKKRYWGCVAMATPDEALLDCGSVSRSKPPCKQRMLAACKPCLPTSSVSVGLLQGYFSVGFFFPSSCFLQGKAKYHMQIIHYSSPLWRGRVFSTKGYGNLL